MDHAIFLVSVSGLKCYECSSFIDERCGTTWKFTGNDGDIFLQECHNDTVGCKKLEYLEERTGNSLISYVTNRLVHGYHLDGSTFILGASCVILFISIFDEITLSKQNSPRWDAAFCGVTSGAIYCLPVSHKRGPLRGGGLCSLKEK